MKRLLTIALTLVACMMMQAKVYTPQTVPHPRSMNADAFVSNPDAILTSAEVEAIQQVAQQLNRMNGVELVTVVLDDIGNADAFEFALALFNHWGIGRSNDNTGVLVFFALQSRDIRITTGGGVEGLLPDATCSRILEDDMIPILSRGRYGEGLLAGNKAIARRLTDQRAMAELLLGYKPKPVTESPWSVLSILSLLIALIAWLRYWVAPQCPKCKCKGAKVRDEIIQKATYSTGGKGLHHYSCPYCGHKWDRSFTTPRIPKQVVYTSGTGRGGGFGGGYHGGSFGGGVSFGGGAGGKF